MVNSLKESDRKNQQKKKGKTNENILTLFHNPQSNQIHQSSLGELWEKGMMRGRLSE